MKRGSWSRLAASRETRYVGVSPRFWQSSLRMDFAVLVDGAVAHGRCRARMRRLQRYSRPPWQPIQLSASCLERSARQRRPEHEHGDAARMRSSQASSSSLARYR